MSGYVGEQRGVAHGLAGWLTGSFTGIFSSERALSSALRSIRQLGIVIPYITNKPVSSNLSGQFTQVKRAINKGDTGAEGRATPRTTPVGSTITSVFGIDSPFLDA